MSSTRSPRSDHAPARFAVIGRLAIRFDARDGRADKLFLPFDDDPVLSLILSKAFMLAEDTKIKDRTIVEQIKGP